METRKEQERKFHDELRDEAYGQRWSPELDESVRDEALWSNMKYYAIERKSRNAVLDWFVDNCKGKTVLDYCCGNGDDSLMMARSGAEKTFGIDISEVSIKNCETLALKSGLQDKTSFRVMDAEALDFEGETFDVVSEYGALHHLNLGKAFGEIARVLRPGGKCICTEALGHNPAIHLYRKKTPHLRTGWEVEHILRKKDIMAAHEFFGRVDFLGFYHLATLAAVPLRGTALFKPLLGALEALDDLLLRLPVLKWQAWQVVFVLSEPRRPAL